MSEEALKEEIDSLRQGILKLTIEAIAVREVLVQVASKLGMKDIKVVAMIEAQDKYSWDRFLSILEKTDPALAAKLDKRKISDVPTEE